MGEIFLASAGRSLIRYRLGPSRKLIEDARIELPQPVQFAAAGVGGRLYAACSDGGVGRPGTDHWLVTVELAQRQMVVCGDPHRLPSRPIHVSLDHPAQKLLVAYNLPAAVGVHAIGADGLLGEHIAFSNDTPIVGQFPHQVLAIPGGEDVLLTCRGDDATAGRPENPGSLRILGIQGRGMVCRSVVAPRGGYGFGPRNCEFDSTGRWVYATLERQNAVSCFRLEGRRILPEPAFTVSTLRAGARRAGVQLAGAARLHPSGRFLYVANRSHDTNSDNGDRVHARGENSIAVFALSDETGEPVLIQSAPVPGIHPRCIDIDASGQTLIAATRDKGTARDGAAITELPAGLTVYAIHDNGHLQEHDRVPVDVTAGPLFWAGFARHVVKTEANR